MIAGEILKQRKVMRSVVWSTAMLVSMMLGFMLSTTQHAEAQSSAYYTAQEVVDSGHQFFGATSGSLA